MRHCQLISYLLQFVVGMKTKQISDLEQEIMNIVWGLDGCSVRDVLEKVNQTKQLAYTTVATVLQRLYEKGLVKRKEERSIIFYSPKVTKKAYGRNVAQSFVRRFVNSFGDTAIASFAGSVDSLPKDKREYFLKLLDQYDKNS